MFTTKAVAQGLLAGDMMKEIEQKMRDAGFVRAEGVPDVWEYRGVHKTPAEIVELVEQITGAKVRNIQARADQELQP